MPTIIAPPFPRIRHTYVNQNNGKHKCSICNDETEHKMSYAANDDGKTHNGTCSDCDYTVTNEQHTYDQPDSSCVCGAKEAKTEKTMTFDFSSTITGMPTSSDSAGKVGTFAQNGITLQYYGCYYYSQYHAIMMVKNKSPYIGNSTAIPGAIIKVEVTTSSNCSGKVKFYIAIADTSSGVLKSHGIGTAYSGGSSKTFNATADKSEDYRYFSVSTNNNSNNGQIVKIVVTYLA